MKKIVLVIGATGRQGGAVVDALLTSSFSVRALVRDAHTSRSEELRAKGAAVIEGDLDDARSLRSAMTGVYGVFSMQNWQNWDGVDAKQKEVEAGIRVADVTQESGVSQLVYSSAGGADRAPDIEAWHGKYLVEQHIKKLGIPYTIIRPVAFMDNFLHPSLPQMLGLYEKALAGKTIQLIASEDIGKWAALAFKDAHNYIGKTLEIAGDELTYSQIQNIFKEVLGHTIETPVLPDRILQVMDDAAKPLDWLREVGYHADIARLRENLPQMLTFKDWLTKHHDGILSLSMPERT